MILFHENELAVRPLTAEDAPRLVKWLSDPEVLTYYEGRDCPHNRERVREHFYDKNDEVMRCIVTFDGREIGYMQYYPISEEERNVYGISDAGAVVFGMDQFIGETAYWNKGIGTELVKATRDHLASLGADMIVMDPQTWNERALRCYEKCGFHKIKLLPEHEWHEGKYRDCWLIAYRVDKEAVE